MTIYPISPLLGKRRGGGDAEMRKATMNAPQHVSLEVSIRVFTSRLHETNTNIIGALISRREGVGALQGLAGSSL